ncbi:MFS transporter, partial [Bacillus safensis]
MKNTVIFSIISFIFWFSQFLYVPVLSPYLETLGGDYLLIGLILSSYGFLQLLCRLPLGILADYLKIRKPFILLGILA